MALGSVLQDLHPSTGDVYAGTVGGQGLCGPMDCQLVSIACGKDRTYIKPMPLSPPVTTQTWPFTEKSLSALRLSVDAMVYDPRAYLLMLGA
jgi:hypothetical protein